jgi:hypothetical protein
MSVRTRENDFVCETLPNGSESSWQGREFAKVYPAFMGTMKITSPGSHQAKFNSGIGILDGIITGVAACDHLDTAPAMSFEFKEQGIFFIGCQSVTGWVSHHGLTTCLENPANGIAQAGPTVRNEPGLAFGQETSKYFRGVMASTDFYQVPCKVSSGDETRVAGLSQSALEGPFNASLFEACGHLLCTIETTFPSGLKALDQDGILDFKTEAHNMHGGACKRN